MRELTEEERATVLERGYEDPVWMLKFYLPHLFPGRIPWVHRGIIAIATGKTDFLLKYGELEKIVKLFYWKPDPEDIRSPKIPVFQLEHDEWGNVTAVHMTIKKFTAIMMPRGFSKTTLMGVGIPLYEILYKIRKFLVYISETDRAARLQLGNIKRELEANELIRTVFGNLVPDRTDREKWTEDMIETKSGVIAVARGRGGQVRGLNIGGQRPDKILIDDLEDKESVKTPEQREKSKEYLYSDVIPALPEMDDNGQVVMLGTLLHAEALMLTVAKDPAWTFVRFAAIDDEGDPLWPEMMTKEKLEMKKQSFVLAGQVNSFNMEYMSQVSNEEDAKFKRRYFQYVPATSGEFVAKAIAWDPAVSDDPKSCFASIAVVGMRDNGKLNVLETWGSITATVREQLDKYFELVAIWKPNYHGVESNAFQAVLKETLHEEMFRQAKKWGPSAYFEVTKITHGTKKDERIESVLQPRYAAGYMEHSHYHPELESQLLMFPNGKKDFPDVTAMAVVLLDPVAAQASFGENGHDLGDDEAEDLDLIFGEDWRYA